MHKNFFYNPTKIISCILISEKQDIKEIIKKHFNQPRQKYKTERLTAFVTKEGWHMHFYFLPQFVPTAANNEYGFTIDQIYYSLKENKIYDPTGRGVNDFNAMPLIIKNTSVPDKWNEIVLMEFILKIGTYFDSKIDEDDFESLKKTSITNLPDIYFLLWTNRPGTALRTLLEIVPRSDVWIFDTILRMMSLWNEKIKEKIMPAKVLTEEKLKLLDLYSDYFNSSGSLTEKQNKGKILVKLLLDT